MQNVTPATISFTNLGEPANGVGRNISSVVLADGRILCLPFDNFGYANIYNPINNGTSIGTIVYTTGYSAGYLTDYGKGVLIKDGRIVFMPGSNSRFLIYAPDYVNLSNTGTYNYTTTPAAAGYSGGSILPDGRVVCVPLTATNIGIYTPDIGVGTFTATGTPTATGYSSCTLLPDGRVLFVPKGAQRIGLYTPDNAGAFNNANTPLATNYDGCILLLDGRVLLISKVSGVKLGIYTPDYTNIEGVGAFDNIITPALPSGAITSACLLPDGRVLIYVSTSWFVIYTPDINGGTYSNLNLFGNTSAVGTCNLTRDGRVIMLPSITGPKPIYAVTGAYPTSLEFCIRPFSRSM
jgi:hypothetical protein